MPPGTPTPLDAVADHPVERTAGRVLLLDADERVLLFQGQDPLEPGRGRWWFTPGGGVDPGESFAEAAARELHEETGLLRPAPALGAPVHERVAEFVHAGTGYRQREQFFLLRIDAHDVDTRGFTALELASVLGHRWWSAQEVRRGAEVVYPGDLAAVLGRAAGGSWVGSC